MVNKNLTVYKASYGISCWIKYKKEQKYYGFITDSVRFYADNDIIAFNRSMLLASRYFGCGLGVDCIDVSLLSLTCGDNFVKFDREISVVKNRVLERIVDIEFNGLIL